jgi:uncharacterized protein YdhG (YjbR/CyaY superfamily)
VDTIDSYIAAAPQERRAVLEQARQVIRAQAPLAEEKISYQMPTFHQRQNLIHFAAMNNHLGIYPGAAGIAEFAAEFDQLGYKHSKGAVQMPWDNVNLELIGRIATFRVHQVNQP